MDSSATPKGEGNLVLKELGLQPINTRKGRRFSHNTGDQTSPTAKLKIQVADSDGSNRAEAGRKDFWSPKACIGLDFQSTGKDSEEITGIGLAGLCDAPCFFPGPPACWPNKVLAALSDCQITKVGHGLKRGILLLKKTGIEVHGSLFDCEVAHALITCGNHHSRDETSPLTLAVPERALTCVQEQRELTEKLQRLRLVQSFCDVEMPLIPVLASMELEGIRVDKQTLLSQRDILTALVEETGTRINDLAHRSVNLDSLSDIGRLLFEELRLSDRPRKTRTGQYATDADTLEMLVNEHPVVRQILDYREQMTLLRSYLEQLPVAINPATGRIHTTYESNETATGRLSSKNPNLQNIPVRSEHGRGIRKAFLPRSADHVLLSADYSQIELRVLASLSHDEALITAFRAGDDIHTATAARVFGTTMEKVTAEMRGKAKMVNYGVAYGMSADGLAHRLGISRSSASQFINQYFAKFPGLRRFINETIESARKNLFVQTTGGRRRYLPDINSINVHARKAAERNAINSPIQGTVAEMMKMSMVKIHGKLSAGHFKSRLLLQVHDELVLDVYLSELTDVAALVESAMKNALPLEIPIAIKIATGTNWLEAH